MPITKIKSCTNEFARSVVVDHNDVYVSGFVNDESLGYLVATYWKNGIETRLSQIGNVQCSILRDHCEFFEYLVVKVNIWLQFFDHFKKRENMKSNLIFLCLIGFLVTSCISTKGTDRNSSSDKTKRRSLPKMVFLVDDYNGGFKRVEIEKEKIPKPIQGSDQWVRDFYGSIKYPAIARENGIQGIVILDIEIDQKGKVTDVGVKKGLSQDCDNEAVRAYIYSTQQGYHPLMINGLPTKFRMELPLGYWLE